MWINLDTKEVELIKNSLAAAHIAIPSFVVGAVELIAKIAEQRATRPEDAIFIEKARELYVDDETEIDDDPAVSPGGDPGCWVAAWVWVSNDDVEACEECGAIPGTPDYGTVGDGFDGLCPSCADKAEAEKEEE
jgi:hypothetical protein